MTKSKGWFAVIIAVGVIAGIAALVPAFREALGAVAVIVLILGVVWLNFVNG
jgi:hypothetical protein